MENSRDRKLLNGGVLVALIGVLCATVLAVAFHFVDSHRWYWNEAPILGVLSVLTAFCGGILVGRGLGARTRHTFAIFALGLLAGIAVMVSN